MKTMRNLLLAGMIPLCCCASGNAQIVYSNNFTLGGTTNVWGTAPTVANDYAGGTSSAAWNDALGTNNTSALLANGSNTTTVGDSWLLPFYPQSGYIYTLTASLTFTGNPGSWVGIGFAQYDPVNASVGNGRFADSAVNGYDWMILTESSGNVQYFTGPKANSPLIYAGTGFAGGPQTLTAQVILNTESNQWTITAYVNGVQMGSTVTYGYYPPIGTVGITQTTLNTPAAVQWNYLTLGAVGPGPTTNTVNATVSFSPTNTGLPLNPSFDGLSYEKMSLANGIFTSNNIALVKLFNLLGPGVLRVGGGTVDIYNWGGLSNCPPITSNDVDELAGFIKAAPNWKVIYGINFASNSAANCAAEAQYAANKLKPQLLGFEIGNEPDEYPYNGIRGSSFSYSDYIPQWNPLKLAAETYGPLVGPATADHTSWTTNFALDESGIISMATQHYYRGNAKAYTNGSPAAMQLLMTPDTNLPGTISTIASAVNTANLRLGFRMDESGSMVNGGLAGISDAYGSALWTLDYMFTLALNGAQGVNFHGGGLSPYSPIINNGMIIQQVGPEFYGLKMFSMLPPGNVIPATVTLATNINFSAYGVRCTSGGCSALLNNKDATNTVAVTVNLGTNVTSAQVIELTGPSLYSTSGFMLGGAAINLDGSWNGGVQAVLSATNGQLTVNVPPISAILLNPILASPEITSNVIGNQLILSWPTNYVGWQLESNSISLMSTNWFPVPGSGDTNRVRLAIQPGQSNVFYRLSLL